MLGVVYDVVLVPPARGVPPDIAEYQSTTEEDRQPDFVTDKFNVPVSHLEAGVAIKSSGTITVTAPETALVTAGEQAPLTTQ